MASVEGICGKCSEICGEADEATSCCPTGCFSGKLSGRCKLLIASFLAVAGSVLVLAVLGGVWVVRGLLAVAGG
ncbi:MAG: hypothetical protein ACYTGB_02715 [Planctomycetota bacterium]|jgi:hypothetical protein